MLKNKKGFTLIELIIVMAIIGILAVVAIVAISGKTVDARNARRMSDIAAVRTALAIACADNKDTLTNDSSSLNPTLCRTGGIPSLVFTNVKDPSVSACEVATAGCNQEAGTLTGTCQYAFGDPADSGDDFDDAPAVTAWKGAAVKPYCNYWINFKLEGQTAKSSATQSGVLKN
ncbi:MAG TPA: type II secretion system protein [bacterium]|nr:type II secretion system protein [bacterium]